MTYLVAAIGVLLAGPVLGRAARARPAWLSLVDGFVLASITVLIGGILVPHSFAVGGAASIGFLALGLAFPFVTEKFQGGHRRTTHAVALAVGISALVLHSVLDGIALASAAAGSAGHAAAVAVILHQLPVGLAVWLLVRPAYGGRRATAVIGVAALTTAVGYALGVPLMDHLSGRGFALVLALVSGSLMHVLFHRHAPHTSATPRLARGLEILGAVAGVLVVAAGEAIGLHAGGHGEHGGGGFAARLWNIARDSAPPLLLGYLLAGAMVVYAPRAARSWLRARTPAGQALRGMAFGLPLPICSCGVTPLYRSLVQGGAPSAAALAFLVATPELGVDSILLTLPLLGGTFTVVRLVAAIVVALVVATVARRWIDESRLRIPIWSGADLETLGGSGPRWLRALRYGFVTVVDETAVWIVLGLVVAAAMSPQWLGDTVGRLPPGGDVILAALVGMPLYVCASGATPLAAALIWSGLSPGAAITFLLSGPATNLTTFGVLRDLHGARFATLFAGAMMVTTVVAGVAANFVLGNQLARVGAPVAPLPETLGTPALWVFLLLLAGAVVRQGVRGFLSPLFDRESGDPGDHRECLRDDGHLSHPHDRPNDHAHTGARP